MPPGSSARSGTELPGRPRAARRAGEPAASLQSGRLVVLVALDIEARALRRRLARAPAGARPAFRTVGLRASGLARLESELGTLRPAAALVAGLAGGCAPSVAPGELVVGSAVGPTPEGTWTTPDARLLRRALRVLQAASLPYRVGRLLTVGDLVASPEAKAEHWQRDQAVAVDMESARVVGWAARHALPILVVRAVADGPTDSVPPALSGALGPAGEVRLGRMLRSASRPFLLGSAWRLWRRSGLAFDRLAQFLAAFAAAPAEP